MPALQTDETPEPAYVPWREHEDVSKIDWAKPYTTESMFTAVEKEPEALSTPPAKPCLRAAALFAIDSTVQEADAPERVETLSGIIEKLANAIGLPVTEIPETVRRLKLRQDPVLKELFGL